MNEEISIEGPIPYKIHTFTKNQLYEIKIESIYDPSKFWMIINFRELALFSDYLTSFYRVEERRLPIPRVKIRKGVPCVVHRNDKYHRAVIQPVVLAEIDKTRVFLVDYGLTVNIQPENIFYLMNKHQLVPRFAIRASLAYISPADDNMAWSLKDLKVFCELVSEKQLHIDVLEIDTILKVLHVNILETVSNMSKSINNHLVEMSLAKVCREIPVNTHEKSDKFKNKIKYMHLIPSFVALEQGTVPCSLWEQNLLRFIPKDVLYPGYFEFNYNYIDGIPIAHEESDLNM